jgi:hypothetical protein
MFHLSSPYAKDGARLFLGDRDGELVTDRTEIPSTFARE